MKKFTRENSNSVLCNEWYTKSSSSVQINQLYSFKSWIIDQNFNYIQIKFTRKNDIRMPVCFKGNKHQGIELNSGGTLVS